MANLLLAADRYLSVVHGSFRLRPKKERLRLCYQAILLQWTCSVLLSCPPALGLLGRFSLEPSGASCSVDFWHGDFRSYFAYASVLTLLGFICPLTIRCDNFFCDEEKVLFSKPSFLFSHAASTASSPPPAN